MGTKSSLRLPLGWILLLLPLLGAGQEPYVNGLAPHFAWGAYNRNQLDAFSFSANKAALARCREPAIALSGERPYGLAALGRYRLAFVIPANIGSIGVQAGYVSAAPYREMMLAAGYGRPLGKLVDLGVQFGFIQMAVPAQPPAAVIMGELGIILHLTGQVNAGWNISVPYDLAKTGGNGTGLRYTMGIGYDPGPSWSAALEIEKGPSSGVSAALGFIYRPHRTILVKMGFTTAGPPIWFGCGYLLKFFELDFSITVHERLGLTPAIGLLKSLKRDQ